MKTLCIQNFIIKKSLRRHQITEAHNSDAQIYKCIQIRLDTKTLCIEIFTKKNNLQIYQIMKAYNSNAQRYICDFYDAIFDVYSNLIKYHKKQHCKLKN